MDNVLYGRVGGGKKCKKKTKLMIIVVSALGYPRYCFTTGQLLHKHATQTTKVNIANET